MLKVKATSPISGTSARHHERWTKSGTNARMISAKRAGKYS